MSNPILTDQRFDKAAQQIGWGAPTAPRVDESGAWAPPMSDGPVSPWTTSAMTLNGTMSALGVLLVLLVAAAIGGWNAVDYGTSGVPTAAWAGVAVGFVCVVALTFKPMWAKVLAPIYALGQGYFVGVVSKFYELAYDGIVVQAIGATIAVASVMLLLYRTRIIKVTSRFRKVVTVATLGLMAFYLFTFVASLFGAEIGAFRNGASPLGILFSVFAAGLAALNLTLDFDFIDRGVERRLPKGMEWVAAFGVLVTLVWLYLELLRLLAKLQRD